MTRLTVVLLLVAQSPTNIPSVLLKPDPSPTMELVANVVRYDPVVTLQTSRAELVVKSTNGRFQRAVYNFYDFGFDQPASMPSQMIPTEMIHDGSIPWKLRVHLPRNAEERAPCTPRSKEPKSIPTGDLCAPAPYVIVPGHEADEPPANTVLPCFIIESWTNLKTGANGPERSQPNTR